MRLVPSQSCRLCRSYRSLLLLCTLTILSTTATPCLDRFSPEAGLANFTDDNFGQSTEPILCAAQGSGHRGPFNESDSNLSVNHVLLQAAANDVIPPVGASQTECLLAKTTSSIIKFALPTALASLISEDQMAHSPETQRPPTTTDPHPQTLRKVIIAGQGRSGTTYLMNLLAGLDPAVFALPEPYFRYEAWQRSNSMFEHFFPKPTLQALLDCTSAQEPQDVSAVLWSFACEHSPTFNKLPALKAQCRASQVSVSKFRHICADSRLRILKILRLPWLFSNLEEHERSNLLPHGVPVIHILRHPAATLRSQALAGWFSVAVFADQAPTDQDFQDNHHIYDSTNQPLYESSRVFLKPVQHYATEICDGMLRTADIIQRQAVAHLTRTIKLEDLTARFDQTMSSVVQALGLNYQEPFVRDTLRTLQQARSAVLPMEFSPSEFSLDEALRVVHSNPACRVAMARFGYV